MECSLPQRRDEMLLEVTHQHEELADAALMSDEVASEVIGKMRVAKWDTASE